METVAFYSYKGGVGRSLLLANAARFLATLGKGVVALDFDFEAPGLHYKLGGGQRSKQKTARKGGAVPYLLAAAQSSSSPPPLAKHLVEVPVPPESGGWLRLMPAGPAPSQEYWTALKALGERLRFDDASGQGVMALLDLQARIAEELKPDYLLIDARTGVTELGGLATALLADTVVCLFVPNQESLDGTLAVVEALKAAPRLKGQKPIRVVPVVARLMGEKLAGDELFGAVVKRLLELGEGKVTGKSKEAALFSLPHDHVLATGDRLVGDEQKASAFSLLDEAHLDFLQRLFSVRASGARQVLSGLSQAIPGKVAADAGVDYTTSEMLRKRQFPRASSEDEITELLLAWSRGDSTALGRLMPLVLDELRRIATRLLRTTELPNQDLEPEDLVSEAYLRLVSRSNVQWEGKAHFYSYAAGLMRRILVDHARAVSRRTLGGRRATEPVSIEPEIDDPEGKLLAEALAALSRIEPRQARIVEMRFFGGLTNEQIAQVLGLTATTVKREWHAAQPWLLRKLSPR